MIHMITTYEHSDGRHIVAKSECNSEQFILGKITYYAQVHANVGGEPMPISVPLDASDIHEAFDVMEAQVNAKGQGIVRENLKRMQAEMQRAQIAQGGRMQLPPLNEKH
jgi:hypothetical protein